MKTFNFYCDESTHIENDGQPFMILSYVSCAINQIEIHSKTIRSLKIKHFFQGEMKWSSLSKSQYPFYNDIIKYFFATDLEFRAIIIDKSQLKHHDFNQSHHDFYDKMYYQLLSKKIFPENFYNIYIDRKDTQSFRKAKSLKKYLERDYFNIRNLQDIQSFESELMQLTDVIMGAINYKLRGLDKVTAKNNIIKEIEKNCKNPLTQPTSKSEKKFNLFFIDLK